MSQWNGRPLHVTAGRYTRRNSGLAGLLFRLRFPLYLYKFYYISEARSAVTILLRRALRWVKGNCNALRFVLTGLMRRADTDGRGVSDP